MNRRDFVWMSGASTLVSTSAFAGANQSNPHTFNPYVIAAVEKLFKERAGGGYGGPGKKDISYAFTQDLAYPNAGQISQYPIAPKRVEHFQHATMCVAGVAEVIVEAINLYGSDQGNIHDLPNPYKLLPADRWNKSNITALRPYIFMQADIRNIWQYPPHQVPVIPIKRDDGSVRVYNAVSRGTAHAFSVFNMGEEIPFDQLLRGDFLNLNRVNGPGHATVFWSYIWLNPITKHAEYSHKWNSKVIGFQFFGAQGPKWPAKGGGFDFRDAIFDGSPRMNVESKLDPGRIIRQSAQLWLNTGRLWSPEKWQVGAATDRINGLVRARTQGTGTVRAAAESAIMREALGPSVYLTTGSEE